MKPKKTYNAVFNPKKVKLTLAQKKQPGKRAKGARFGKRWFPFPKKTAK